MVLLAATLIAIGNSLQDYYANSGMSALGYGIMAVSGTIAGPLFNFLIGFGLNITKGCYYNGTLEFNLFGATSYKKVSNFIIEKKSSGDSNIFS